MTTVDKSEMTQEEASSIIGYLLGSAVSLAFTAKLSRNDLNEIIRLYWKQEMERYNDQNR